MHPSALPLPSPSQPSSWRSEGIKHIGDRPSAPPGVCSRSLSIISHQTVPIFSLFLFFSPVQPIHHPTSVPAPLRNYLLEGWGLSKAPSGTIVSGNTNLRPRHAHLCRFCGNFPPFGKGAIGPFSLRVLGRYRTPAPTSKDRVEGYTYSGSGTSSEVTRFLRSGDLVLEGTDRSLVPNLLERALIPGPLTLCSGRQISRLSHNRHNVILDS